MRKTIAMKRKIVEAVLSAALIATAFNPGSCTVTVDENLINEVTTWLDNFELPGMDMPCADLPAGRCQSGQ
jgi:hypothetical protein